MAKIIPLTKGYSTVVDDEDYAWLSSTHSWVACDGSHSVYACAMINRRHVSMHRMILGILDQPGTIGDHINRNTLDNRRSNLRIVTKSQSAQNTGLRRNSTTGVRNVTFVKSRNRYRVIFMDEYVVTYDRYFRTLEEAAQDADRERARRSKERSFLIP